MNPDEYDYHLPAELIATVPTEPRDSARLLVFSRQTDQVNFDTFANLTQYLPPKSVIVFNETKVVPARLELSKNSGGRLRILWLGAHQTGITALADHKLKIGDTLKHQEQEILKVENYDRGIYTFSSLIPSSAIEQLFASSGLTPLPPYIKNSPLSEAERRAKYQTVFAKNPGSVAAPTASLHFTPELLERLRAAGHSLVYLTLHVGLGTFAPLSPEQLRNGTLHDEKYFIPEATAQVINQAKADGQPIVAVGTTAARTLESAATALGRIHNLSGSTNLFIQPGYQFKCVDHLITNFHVPKSSLMMLVASLVGREKILDLYRQAIDQRFRFFSFGDGMLII